MDLSNFFIPINYLNIMEMDFFEESINSFIETKHHRKRKPNNYKKFKYYLYIFISPVLLISLIYLCYKIQNLKNTKDIKKDNLKPIEPEIQIEEEEEINGKEEKILLTNSFIRKPLTDNRIYEIIQLSNGINSVIISDINATRAGIIVGINFEGYSNLIFKAFQRIIYNNTDEGKNFKYMIKKNFGNTKVYTNKGINYYYFDSESDNFSECILSLYNMLHNINISKISEDIIKEINNLKNNSESENDMFFEVIEISDYFFFPEEENLYLNNNLIKDLYENIYNNPSKISISIISNQTINESKLLLNLTWSKLKKKKYNNINNKIMSKYKILDENFRKFIFFKSKVNNDFEHLIFLCDEENFNELNSMSLYNYVAYLLNYHGNETLSYNLRKDKYIENLYVNVNKLSVNSPYYFLISVKLTSKGFNNFTLVIKFIYEYLISLSKYNNYSETFNDYSIINEQKFNFYTINKYWNYLETITQQLFLINTKNEKSITKEQLSNLIYNPFNSGKFNNEKLNKIFNHLINSNNIGYLMSTDEYLYQNISQTYKNFNNMKIYYYNINISYMREMRKNLTKKIIENPEEFKIREKNQYVSKVNFIKTEYEKEYNYELKGYETILYEKYKNLLIYYKLDKSFSIPRVETYIYFNYYKEEKMSDMLQIVFYNHIKSLIEFNFEDAFQSGNFISIQFLRYEGFIIKISAYFDKIYYIISNLISMIMNKNNFFYVSYLDYKFISYDNQNEKYFDYMRTFSLKKGENTQNVIMIKEIDPLVKPLFLIDYHRKFESNVYTKTLLFGIFDKNNLNLIKNVFENKMNNAQKIEEIEKKPNQLNDKINKTFLENKCIIYAYNHTFWNDDKHYLINSIKIGENNILNEIYADILILIWKENFEFESEIEKIYYANYTFIKITKNDFWKFPHELLEKNIDLEMKKIVSIINDIEKDDFNYYIGKLKLDLKKVIKTKEKANKSFDYILSFNPLMIEKEKYIEILNTFNLNDFQNNAKKILKNNLMIIFEFYKSGTLTKFHSQTTYFEIINNICEIQIFL